MIQTYSYKVAETEFSVTMPEEIGVRAREEQYKPFHIEHCENEAFNLSFEIVDDLYSLPIGEHIDTFNDESPYLWIFKNGDQYNIGFSMSKDALESIMICDRVYIKSGQHRMRTECCINNSIMIRYTLACSFNNSLMIHSSVILHGGKAYAFLGKSGTGKSTHSKLWLTNIEDTELLNDDNPVIHFIEDEAYIYGTPWSGKTPCYKNSRAPLGGLVKLRQAPYNKIERLGVMHALAQFMTSCSNIRWNKKSSNATMTTIGKVVQEVPIWGLDCLPDADAAHLCESNITKLSAK